MKLSPIYLYQSVSLGVISNQMILLPRGVPGHFVQQTLSSEDCSTHLLEVDQGVTSRQLRGPSHTHQSQQQRGQF